MGVSDVKVYTVNGAASGSSSSLPDWLTRKRTISKKRSKKEHVESTLQLIQNFEFPEASIRVRTTRDGCHAIATGVYKPQMRVWDLNQLSTKFERHTDSENIDFVILSDDWTKTLHLQADRTLELHNQQGFHYRTRIPRMGRSLAYHFPSCDAYVGGTGEEVYRLNLNEGRFMTPLTVHGNDQFSVVEGVNVVDINPAHQLVALGIDGASLVEFWDPRSKALAATLTLPVSRFFPPSLGPSVSPLLSITALASRSDGLSLAVGTSTGHSVLYDLRSSIPLASKDQGYGLPITSLHWLDSLGSGKMAGENLIMSADRKVMKIWNRADPGSNYASITPSNDINFVHHIPASGLFMVAHEGIELSTLYIPQLGPAPKWCRFLDNITEEMEDQTVRSVYEDYKFVERSELVRLGLDSLIGTPALKPYMHGFFMQLKLYDQARLISNPFAYDEHREKVLQEKLNKLANSRIRVNEKKVKVNKRLAEKILKAEEKAAKKVERRNNKEGEETTSQEKTTLLNDPRFSAMFEDPEYQIDETSREFELLNPSTVANRHTQDSGDEDSGDLRSDQDDDKDEDSDSQESESDEVSINEDSLPASRVSEYNPHSRRQTKPSPRLVPVSVDIERSRMTRTVNNWSNQDSTFGQRRNRGLKNGKSTTSASSNGEITYIPVSSKESSRSQKPASAVKRGGRQFTLQREDTEPEEARLSENDRRGRSKRRMNVRSGSKNVFRRM